VVDDEENGLAPSAETVLKLADVGKAVEIADTFERVTCSTDRRHRQGAQTLKILGTKPAS